MDGKDLVVRQIVQDLGIVQPESLQRPRSLPLPSHKQENRQGEWEEAVDAEFTTYDFFSPNGQAVLVVFLPKQFAGMTVALHNRSSTSFDPDLIADVEQRRINGTTYTFAIFPDVPLDARPTQNMWSFKLLDHSIPIYSPRIRLVQMRYPKLYSLTIKDRDFGSDVEEILRRGY
jgi:hypothetical protein